MSYLKIENNLIVEAPATIQKNGYTIIGYNTKINQKMLFEDGYNYFEYTKDYYKIQNNQIVYNKDHQKQDPLNPSYQSNVFTKRQIRLALRKLNKEDVLNNILNSDQLIKLDWDEAQDIDLNNEETKNIITQFGITQEQIELLKQTIKSL